MTSTDFPMNAQSPQQGRVTATDTPRLKSGVLDLFEVTTSGLAMVAPGACFFFNFAAIALVSGIASPLTMVVAAIAVLLLCNTLSEFCKRTPSVGSFVTLIGKSWGAPAATTSSILLNVGYVITFAAGAPAIAGGIIQMVLHVFNIDAPWQPFAILASGLALFLMVGGIKSSTDWAGIFFIFELLFLVTISVVLLVGHASSVSLAPFDPGHLPGGMAGLALGFPIAMQLFLGWENPPPLAEETVNVRRVAPRAIYAITIISGVIYTLLAFATVIGYNQNAATMGKSSIPLLDLANGLGGWVFLIALLVGFTSTIGVIITAINQQSRLMFSSSREGLLPGVFARLTPHTRVPRLAYFVSFGVGTVVLIVFSSIFPLDPVSVFSDLTVLGTIMLLFVFLASNVALPFYMKRNHATEFRVVRHLALPVLGAVMIGYPLVTLIEPQPGLKAPVTLLPWISLSVLVVAIGYAILRTLQDRALGDRIGSVIADAE